MDVPVFGGGGSYLACLVDEVGVFEMDKVKHWLKGKHKRRSMT